MPKRKRKKIKKQKFKFKRKNRKLKKFSKKKIKKPIKSKKSRKKRKKKNPQKKNKKLKVQSRSVSLAIKLIRAGEKFKSLFRFLFPLLHIMNLLFKAVLEVFVGLKNILNLKAFTQLFDIAINLIFCSALFLDFL